MATRDGNWSHPTGTAKLSGDADHCKVGGHDFRLGTKRRAGRTSLLALVGGACLAIVGVLFMLGAAGAEPEDFVPLLVIGSVLIGIGALFGWLAFCIDALTIARRKGRRSKYNNWHEVPWYRREPSCLVFLAVLIFAPVTVALCIVCLTGEVYRNSHDAEGNLQVWGVGNKIAAVLILVIQIGFTLLYVAAHR